MKRLFEYRLFWFIMLAAVLGLTLLLGINDWRRKDRFYISDLLASPQEVAGTETHTEREYKLKIEGVGSRQNPILQKTIHDGILEFMKLPNLQVPKLVGRPFRVRHDESPFVFLDFYFDSPNFDLDKLGLTYRLRYRWKTVPDFVRYINGGRNSEDNPIRCEIQCKHNRVELTNGYSETLEARFEFRTESHPFGPLFPAPAAPWPFLDFLKIAQQGRFDGHVMRPSYECAQDLRDRLQLDHLDLLPAFAVLDIRTRSHLLIKTRWGTGPMPDDAAIITLDNFWYTADVFPMLKAMQEANPRKALAIRHLFREFGAELEIEFERNVAFGLEKAVRANDEEEKSRALQVEQAFLADISMLKDKLISDLQLRGMVARGVNQSKIKQIRAYMESQKHPNPKS